MRDAAYEEGEETADEDILVTGAAGFIGSNFVRQVLAEEPGGVSSPTTR